MFAVDAVRQKPRPTTTRANHQAAKETETLMNDAFIIKRMFYSNIVLFKCMWHLHTIDRPKKVKKNSCATFNVHCEVHKPRLEASRANHQMKL